MLVYTDLQSDNWTIARHNRRSAGDRLLSFRKRQGLFAAGQRQVNLGEVLPEQLQPPPGVIDRIVVIDDNKECLLRRLFLPVGMV